MVILRISYPELAGGVLIEHDRLHAALGNRYREARIEGVASGCRVVAVAGYAGAVGAVRAARSGADGVEVVAVPKSVGFGEVALVDEGTGVVSGVRRPLVTVDVILLGGAVEEYTPPEAVVEPQFALGHHRSGGTTHAGGSEGEVPVAHVAGGQGPAGNEKSYRRRKQHQNGSSHPYLLL